MIPTYFKTKWVNLPMRNQAAIIIHKADIWHSKGLRIPNSIFRWWSVGCRFLRLKRTKTLSDIRPTWGKCQCIWACRSCHRWKKIGFASGSCPIRSRLNSKSTWTWQIGLNTTKKSSKSGNRPKRRNRLYSIRGSCNLRQTIKKLWLCWAHI